VASVLTEIVADCEDPQRVADFWSQVLGWKVQQQEGYCWMSASGDPAERDIKLVFVKVPEPKTVKNRWHIDVNPRRADQAEEVERIIALGAQRVDIGQGDVPWVVLADPEGNEFCVLGRRVD
jgi:predicted enzyme related to lactoylglutathione lyase